MRRNDKDKVPLSIKAGDRKCGGWNRVSCVNPFFFFLFTFLFLHPPFFLLTVARSLEHILFSFSLRYATFIAYRGAGGTKAMSPLSARTPSHAATLRHDNLYLFIHIYIYILEKIGKKFRFSLWNSYRAPIHHACIYPNLSKLGPVQNVGSSRNGSTKEKCPKQNLSTELVGHFSQPVIG